jgi:ADP-ribose pyrophosphatase YjhB (NUDIX family)
MKHLEEKRKKEINSCKFSDEVYAQILDSVVIACADSVLICDGQMFLAKRNIEPRANHWAIVGGRMIAGERPEETARRKLFLETGLQIDDLSRFKFYEVYSACYPVRQQAPQENGSHTINFTHLLEISSEEKAEIKLTLSEYEDSRWVNFEEVIDFLEKDNEDSYIKTILFDALKNLQLIES